MNPLPPPIRDSRNVTGDLGQILPTPVSRFFPLESRVRLYWLLGRVFFWGFVWMLFLFAGLLGQLGGWLPVSMAIFVVPVLMMLSILHLIWPFFAYRHWGYAVRETDLLIRSGVCWRRMVAIPFKRVQHVDSRSGPLERLLGLATLVVYTAGSQMGSESIPGLSPEEAENLRDYLSQKGHAHANF